ncbi:hypothetical protein PANA5342_4195 [Pantoea ananatis LMG 5342]|nr:hypothetical protein PANA5342_4195 [Pantoea ananatis LMG 5342]
MAETVCAKQPKDINENATAAAADVTLLIFIILPLYFS